MPIAWSESMRECCGAAQDDGNHHHIAKRTSQGKSPREARRCLKRYIARHLYRLLENPPPPNLSPPCRNGPSAGHPPTQPA